MFTPSHNDNDIILNTRMYSSDILPVMQSILSTLANIDYEHDCELEQLENSQTPLEIKNHIAAKLKERHRERREAYVQHLANLQTQALPIMHKRESRG